MRILRTLYCAIYITILGRVFLRIGNTYPREWFHADRFPYRTAQWERGGKIYRMLGVQHWKDHLPDMSKVTKGMYRKEIVTRPTEESLIRLIQETCTAELVHWQLMVFSAPVMWIYPGLVGRVIWAGCILGNLVFVIIQRYNRPRLRHALERMEKTAV